nr:MAG TPA: hypothetical protein [Caudoviricetes sp.]
MSILYFPLTYLGFLKSFPRLAYNTSSYVLPLSK